MGKRNEKRDAALYDAWTMFNGKNEPMRFGCLKLLAQKYGVCTTTISLAIKRERERRALHD